MPALYLCVRRPGCKWLLMTAAAGCKLSMGSPNAEPGPGGRRAAAGRAQPPAPAAKGAQRARSGCAGQRGAGARSGRGRRQREHAGGRGSAQAARLAGKILSGSCKFPTGRRRSRGGESRGCAAPGSRHFPKPGLGVGGSGGRGWGREAGVPLAAAGRLLRAGEPAVRLQSVSLSVPLDSLF